MAIPLLTAGNRSTFPCMSIAVLIRAEEAEKLLPWAEAIARARGEDLLVVRASKDGSSESTGEFLVPPTEDLLTWIREDKFGVQSESESPAADSDVPGSSPETPEDSDALTITLCSTPKDESGEAMLSFLEERRPSLLILPRPLAAEGLVRNIFRAANCATMILDLGVSETTELETTPAHAQPRILVPISTGNNARLALELACRIAGEKGRVEALYVEPRIGQEAERVGRKILSQEIRKALSSSEVNTIQIRVTIANDPAEGIIDVVKSGRYDLVLVGASEGLATPRMRRGTIPDRIRKEVNQCPVGVVRRGIPLAYLLERRLIRLLRAVVPQLSREERVELVGKIQSSSSFNFDFVTLVCLSTLIAGLGLIRNSAAVVIGAMLVAPLMTPLVGCGLALVHGNLILIRNAARSVLLGFTLSFGIGFLLGALIPGVVETEELLGRGQPDVLDLLVAAASGLAAAYATARPALSGALPGLAIAAALVPPIATSGIAGAMGEWRLAFGALLLFLANIVAIVLGASVSLYAVGLRGDRPSDRRKLWIRPTIVALLVFAFVIAIGLSHSMYSALPAARVTSELRTEIEEILHEEELQWGSRPPQTRPRREAEETSNSVATVLEVWVEAASTPRQEISERIATVATKSLGIPTRVRLITEIVVVSDEGSPTPSIR